MSSSKERVVADKTILRTQKDNTSCKRAIVAAERHLQKDNGMPEVVLLFGKGSIDAGKH